MASNSSSPSKALVLSTINPSPPRPLLYKPFQFLKSLSLDSMGMGLTDIPSSGRRELVFLVGSIGCPISIESETAQSGPQGSFLETPETGDEFFDASLDAMRVEDPLENPQGADSEEVEESFAPPEAEIPSPATHTGEKRKRVKSVARRVRTPRNRPQPRSQTSVPSSSPPSSKPSRTSARLAFKPSSKPSSKPTFKSLDTILEEVSSSSSSDSQRSESENTPFKEGTPVFPESSEEQDPPKPSFSKASRKRKPGSSSSAPSSKKSKSTSPSPLSARQAQFLRRHVVRGKIINTSMFQKHGLEVFLNKLRAQGWLDLFANTQLGCSQPELVEFYTNCSVTEGVVTSSVHGVNIQFDAPSLGRMLEVPSHGFATYVREDKSALSATKLLEVCRHLSQNPGLKTPSPIKKGDMTSLHQLLFMFLIRNIIPRGQGRNAADPFDQVLVDLMDKEEPINLPAIMIRHIGRITNTTRPHDLGYGFLLTRVFEQLGLEFTKKVAAQSSDEIGLDTLMGCGYEVGAGSASTQPRRIPRPPVPQQSPQLEAILADNARLKDELAEVRAALARERELSAKRFAELHTLFSALAPSIPPLQTQPPPPR